MRQEKRDSVVPGGAPPVIVSRFSTEPFAPEERFAAWTDAIGVLFEVRRPDDDPRPFAATLMAVQFGPTLLAATRAPRQTFRRDRVRACADGLDQYLVQLYREGEATAWFGDDAAPLSLAAGDLLLIDAAQPSFFDCGDFDNLTLLVPRALLDQRMPGAARLHGRPLPRGDAAVRMLAGTLDLMHRLAPEMRPDTAVDLADTLLDLVARCLSSVAPEAAGTETERKGATIEAVKRHIEEHLDAPDLDPNTLLAAFRMSRAYLYELFEPHGGVVNYIRQRRLARCLVALRAPGNRHRKIADIAFAHGFASESHFSRAFRKAFGMTPSEARALPPAQGAPADEGPESGRRYQTWLRAIDPASAPPRRHRRADRPD